MASNWAGNHTYEATAVVRPASVAELSEVVASNEKVRALGTRHSFSDLPDTTGVLVELAGLPEVIEVDPGSLTVSVSAGVTYARLADQLARGGWALANLASLPHLGIAGAVATGTHGSGDGNRCLSASVTAMDLVGPDGETWSTARGDADFAGSVVSLGALGVVHRLTLRVEPAYEVLGTQFTGLSWDALDGHFDEVMSAGYSVSMFTRWTDQVDQVWVKSRDGRPPVGGLYDAVESGTTLHMLPDGDAGAVTGQREPGPWHERLAHFRWDATPSHGAEIQSEYFVPRAHAPQAVAALRRIGRQLSGVLLTSEVRTVAADDLWLSGAYDQDVAAFHFTWARRPEAVHAAVELVEEALMPLQARPHWGKYFSLGSCVLERVHPKLTSFVDLAREVDPGGKFWNGFLQHRLGDVR
ncbi:FAD-binding protein [Nocardioides astragali]|uniref:FAD-binding protein n=1 Tax=Nocardioides astragali TaxID=1776736 RepID=A0ABW2NDK9_9ACTN|nr:FAD-binding protein [Nocardioides astragali]